MDGISTYNSFIALHKPQLLLSGIPEYFWHTLCKKLHEQIFDSGLTFQLVKIDYEDSIKMPYDPLWSVIALRDIDRGDSSHIYLVDHAWTFKPNSIKTNLRNIPGLLERMCNLMQVDTSTREAQIEEVANTVWKYANTYSVEGDFSVEDRVPLWYVLDELGSGITHSDNANFRAVPFIFVPEQATYTLLFPLESVEEGDIITRSFIEGQFSDPLQREAMLIPWKRYENFQDDYTQQEPKIDYFLEGHLVETLPNIDAIKSETRNRPLKVYSEYSYIQQYLTAPEFEIVPNEDDADILWYLTHFTSFRELSENSANKYVNQFPFEYVITSKDLLPIISRRCGGHELVENMDTFPLWLPATFNLKTELPKLAAFYMQRKKAGLGNVWTCKPYNLARGLDTFITENLDCLCRLPVSGPKIAQKYIENPVLFNRPNIGMVKFDIRYVILLKSVNPTEVYVYNNFFLRFSNKPFSLNNFDDYEQHFTVMNYTENISLYKLLSNEFIHEWGKQFENNKWADVEKTIFDMLAELFTAATSKEVPCGIDKSPQSRALYAADIMLSWDKRSNVDVIQPKLLEINWMPDCQRACEYYNDFYNDIFSVLFLNKEVTTCTKIL